MRPSKARLARLAQEARAEAELKTLEERKKQAEEAAKVEAAPQIIALGEEHVEITADLKVEMPHHMESVLVKEPALEERVSYYSTLPIFVTTDLSITAFFRDEHVGVRFQTITEEEARRIASNAAQFQRLHSLTKDRNEQAWLGGFLKTRNPIREDNRLFRKGSSRVLICTMLNDIGMSYTLITPLTRRADGSFDALG